MISRCRVKHDERLKLVPLEVCETLIGFDGEVLKVARASELVVGCSPWVLLSTFIGGRPVASCRILLVHKKPTHVPVAYSSGQQEHQS
jgi:hypothetical protein